MYFFARFTQGYPIPYSYMQDIHPLHSYVNFQVNWEMYCKNNKISKKNQNCTQACPGCHSAVKAPVLVTLGRNWKIYTAALPVCFTKERGRKGKVEKQISVQTSVVDGAEEGFIQSFIHSCWLLGVPHFWSVLQALWHRFSPEVPSPEVIFLPTLF